MSEEIYLSDPFFSERIDMEKQFLNFLQKSGIRRNINIKLVNQNKEEITKLRADTIGFDFKKDVVDFKDKNETIEKLKTETKELEKKILFFDELIKDYAQDFESRRELKDRDDRKALNLNKNVFICDIRTTQRSVDRQNCELRSLNSSISQYYFNFPEKPKNIDIDDLISKKRILVKEIIEKTNFILDCERKLELIDVKLRFISPPSREVQATCSKEENLLNFFKLVHVKGSLSKTIGDLQFFIDQLKPKLVELDKQLHKYDQQFSESNVEFGIDDLKKELPDLFDDLDKESRNLKRIVNDHAIQFFGSDAYAKKWTVLHLRQCIEEVRKQLNKDNEKPLELDHNENTDESCDHNRNDEIQQTDENLVSHSTHRVNSKQDQIYSNSKEIDFIAID